jgi:hypothetical protein
MPGAVLVLLGALGYLVALPRATIRHVTFDAHTLLFASLAILCGYQSIQFSFVSRALAIGAGLLPEDSRLSAFVSRAGLDRVLVVGVLGLLAGVALLLVAVNEWRLVDFGDLDYRRTMRWVIPGATLTALGFQTVLGSFLLGILTTGRTEGRGDAAVRPMDDARP